MNTKRIHKLLIRMQGAAQGLEGVCWTTTFYAEDKAYLSQQTEAMQVQLDNLQADLDELKREVQP